MPLPNHRAETIHEQVVLAQHLHIGVLDQLAGATAREKGRTLCFPGVPDGVAREAASLYRSSASEKKSL